jgi:lipopolysaccharide export system protein LptC
MRDPRTSANRFQLGMLLTVVTMLALGSFWLLDVMRRGMEQSAPLIKRTEPDYYVENFNFVKMTKSGQVRYHISGARLTHNPQDGSYEIFNPVVKSLSDTQPPTTIVAKRGMADANLEQVQLFDAVQMERPASPDAEAMRVTSEHMLVLPEEDVMRTDRPVKITVGEAILRGIGMFANQATREFRLASQVRGVFPPQAAR